MRPVNTVTCSPAPQWGSTLAFHHRRGEPAFRALPSLRAHACAHAHPSPHTHTHAFPSPRTHTSTHTRSRHHAHARTHAHGHARLDTGVQCCAASAWNQRCAAGRGGQSSTAMLPGPHSHGKKGPSVCGANGELEVHFGNASAGLPRHLQGWEGIDASEYAAVQLGFPATELLGALIYEGCLRPCSRALGFFPERTHVFSSSPAEWTLFTSYFQPPLFLFLLLFFPGHSLKSSQVFFSLQRAGAHFGSTVRPDCATKKSPAPAQPWDPGGPEWSGRVSQPSRYCGISKT